MAVDDVASSHRMAPARRAAVVSLGAAAVFALLAAGVLAGAWRPLDYSLMRWAAALHRSAVDRVMGVVTELGSGPVLTALVAGVCLWLVQWRDYSAAVTVAGMVIVADLLSSLFKTLFARPRPELFAGVLVPQSYAFPSGHATATMAAFGMVAVVVTRYRPDLRLLAPVAAAIIIVAVGASRVLLGVHWPTDVLAGFALGAVPLGAGAAVLAWRDRQPPAT